MLGDRCADRRIRLSTGELDLLSGILSSSRGSVQLTELERGLLAYLYARRGQIIGRGELLEQVWGYRPGVRSHTLETTIQRLRAKIERNVRSPEHLLNVRGRGYRLVIGDPALPSSGARTTDGVGLLEPIFGREDEIGTLGSWMASGVRLVTVTGPPGIGKTWFVREILGRLQASSPSPDLAFVDLGEIRTRAELFEALTAAFGGPVEGRARRSGTEVWVLDDAQQLDVQAAEQIRGWLQRNPDLTVIATSHARLGIEGERALPLELLTVEAAIQVFRSRLCALAIPDPGDEALEALALRTERLPLLLDAVAVSLSTELTHDVDVQRILDIPPPRRTGGARTLRMAVASAIGRLECRLLRALSELASLRGAFCADAAEAVLTDGGRGALIELWRRSLVRRLPDGRFALYEAVRSCLIEGAAPDGRVGRLSR